MEEQSNGTRVSIMLYDNDLRIVERVAKDTGIRHTSATIRHIINDWARKNLRGDEPEAVPAGASR